MGNRLSRITTRSGDGGTTGLADGSRLPKDAPRIEALGDVDELNSWLGLLICEMPLDDQARPVLEEVQQVLFNLGGELAMPGTELVTQAQVVVLEEALAEANAELPPLREFVLPGGNRAAAVCHLARSVCRRAERRLVQLEASEPATSQSGRYLNRLSDLLFVFARQLARREGSGEVLWRNPSPKHQGEKPAAED